MISGGDIVITRKMAQAINAFANQRTRNTEPVIPDRYIGKKIGQDLHGDSADRYITVKLSPLSSRRSEKDTRSEADTMSTNGNVHRTCYLHDAENFEARDGRKMMVESFGHNKSCPDGVRLVRKIDSDTAKIIIGALFLNEVSDMTAEEKTQAESLRRAIGLENPKTEALEPVRLNDPEACKKAGLIVKITADSNRE